MPLGISSAMLPWLDLLVPFEVDYDAGNSESNLDNWFRGKEVKFLF
jgi:hypothetical protein